MTTTSEHPDDARQGASSLVAAIGPGVVVRAFVGPAVMASVAFGGSVQAAAAMRPVSAVPEASATSATTASMTPTSAAAPLPPPPPPLTEYDPARDAEADVAAALASARADGRLMLLVFGANWCRDSTALLRLLQAPTVRSVLDGYHVVTIDVGRIDRRLELAAAHGLDLRKSGIPALVVMTGTGTVLATTNDGSFSHARSMTAEQIVAFLERRR